MALIEEIAPRAEEMAGAAAIREVLVCSTEPTNVGKIFVVKFIRVKYFRTFSVYENIFTTKLKRMTVFATVCISAGLRRLGRTLLYQKNSIACMSKQYPGNLFVVRMFQATKY